MKSLLLSLPLLLSGLLSPKAPSIKLPGYFCCRSSLLRSDEKAALSCYATTQAECQQGKTILAYERRTSPKGTFAIVDTLQLTLHYPANDLSISECTAADGKLKQYFVLCRQDALGEKYLRNVLRVWGVNAQGRLVEMPLKMFKCLNHDFGA